MTDKPDSAALDELQAATAYVKDYVNRNPPNEKTGFIWENIIDAMMFKHQALQREVSGGALLKSNDKLAEMQTLTDQQAEIENLKIANDAIDDNLMEAEAANSSLVKRIGELEEKLTRYKAKIGDYQTRIELQTEEIERLREALKNAKGEK